ncbi:MAG TPA: zinc ABC transporter substrate-binding protein [Planctomycetota bacterium]|nr:zinc ABC transporter substrate-binding protein [Planctomycetota bacterium]
MRSAALLLIAVWAGAFAAEPLRVVATTGVLADLARQVGGERVAVSVLLPAGGDVHVFQPTPDDAHRLREAAVLVENGLGLEGWIDGLVTASGFAGSRVVAARGVETIAIACGHDHHDHDHEHAPDPHAWQDARNAMRYVDNLAEGFAAADPAGAAHYASLASLYRAQLRALDAWIRAEVAAIPPERRVLATPHAAFAYFAAAYGFEQVSLAGAMPESQTDPSSVAALVARLRGAGVPVFAERGANPRPIENLARDAGSRLAGTLAADGLGEGGYIATQAANVRALVEGLR